MSARGPWTYDDEQRERDAIAESIWMEDEERRRYEESLDWGDDQ